MEINESCCKKCFNCDGAFRNISYSKCGVNTQEWIDCKIFNRVENFKKTCIFCNRAFALDSADIVFPL